MKDIGKVVIELQNSFSNGLAPSENLLPAGIQIVNDRKTALWLCDLGTRPWLLKNFPQELSTPWTDVLEHVSGSLGFRLNQNGVEFSDVMKAVYQMESFWSNYLDDSDLFEFSDTMDQYSKIMISHRMLDVGPEELGEWLFLVLRAGGMPCGCVGKWPEKPLAVYWPHEAPPKFK